MLGLPRNPPTMGDTNQVEQPVVETNFQGNVDVCQTGLTAEQLVSSGCWPIMHQVFRAALTS